MFVDAKTSRELELFSGNRSRPAVLDMLDYTCTKGGRRALQNRMKHPLPDSRAIRHVQSGVRFLLELEVDFPINEELIRSVSLYLDSSWEIGLRRRGVLRVVESYWVAWRYRDFMRYVDQGVTAVTALLHGVQGLLDLFEERNPPGEVGDLVVRLAELMSRIDPDSIRTERYPWAVLDTDRTLRERHRADLLSLVDLAFELDALCSMAVAGKTCGLTFPEIVEGRELLVEGDGLFHLFLKDPVVNPVRLATGESLMFLTGPNMAGKTTYMKAVAVAVVLAHLGMGVPARSLRLTPLEALFTSLTPEDNLRSGLSYFMAEVKRVREIVQGVLKWERALVLVDEVFKGTNVRDALEASRLVIRGFSQSRTSGFIVSSHLVELAGELNYHESIRFLQFDGNIKDGKAEYQYTLRSGVSNQRFALQLLHEEGVPQLLDELASAGPGHVNPHRGEPRVYASFSRRPLGSGMTPTTVHGPAAAQDRE
jgi:DNA mismatch repair ATPase MutS